MIEIDQINGELDAVCQRAACGFRDCHEISEHLICLGGDIALHQHHRFRVERDLSRQVNRLINADGL